MSIIIIFITINAFGEEKQTTHPQGTEQSVLSESEMGNALTKLKADQKKLKTEYTGSNRRLLNEIERLKKTNAALNSDIDAVKIEYREQTKQYQEELKYRTIYFVVLLAVTILALLWVAMIVKNRVKHQILLEKIIGQDSSLVSYLKDQLDSMKTSSQTSKTSDSSVHSFPVRVASEIYRMKKRIENMDENTKGLNALKNALNRLDDDLNQRGYIIKDLSGDQYIDELTVKIANTIERNDLEPGSQIISRMIEPQIEFNGVVVGHGEAELAVGVKK